MRASTSMSKTAFVVILSACVHVSTIEERIEFCTSFVQNRKGSSLDQCLAQKRAEALAAEHENAQRRRTAAAIFLAGLAGFAEGYTSTPRNTVQPTYTTQAGPTGPAPQYNQCKSDLDCKANQECTKSPYSLTGFCATPVNSNGIPVLPSLDGNLGPGTHQCWITSDCPLGFDCINERCVR